MSRRKLMGDAPETGDQAAIEPLARHLADWDLLPPHALLSRRRVVRRPPEPAAVEPVSPAPARAVAPLARPGPESSSAGEPPPVFMGPADETAVEETLTCGACETVLEPGARFCTECGRPQ